MTDEHMPARKNQNIFDYLVSSLDIKTLKNAMAISLKSIPQSIEITFQHHDRRTDCLCHVYRGERGYFISGWKLPNKIIRFPLQETAAW